jgi:hypothetical protein
MPKYIQHLRGLSKSALETEIDSKIADNYHDIIHDEALSGPTAETNADGWGMDTYEVIDKAEDIDLSSSRVQVNITAQACGDQDPDKPWCGDVIDVEATAVIDDEGDVSFDDVVAAVKWPVEEPAED